MTAASDFPLTYLITPGEAMSSDFSTSKTRILNTIELAVAAGISMIQIRERFLTTRQLFELSRAAVELTKASATKLLVNDRLDIAIAAGAAGVHLPERGLPVAAVRYACPRPFVIGASAHSVEGAITAAADGADFVLFGPVFDSGEKKGVGTDKLSEVTSAVNQIPVLAVGGIDVSNIDLVIEAGAGGYAAIRYLNDHAVLEKLRY